MHQSWVITRVILEFMKWNDFYVSKSSINSTLIHKTDLKPGEKLPGLAFSPQYLTFLPWYLTFFALCLNSSTSNWTSNHPSFASSSTWHASNYFLLELETRAKPPTRPSLLYSIRNKFITVLVNFYFWTKPVFPLKMAKLKL